MLGGRNDVSLAPHQVSQRYADAGHIAKASSMFVQWTLLSGETSVLFTRIFLPLNIEPSVVSPRVSI